MDLNNHILNNTCRAHDRKLQGRMENNINQYDYEDKKICNTCEIKCKNEHGGKVHIENIARIGFKNNNFRESIWTGKHLQMTLMCIPCGEDIGIENHCDTDQYIRIEHGYAMALTGNRKDALCDRYKLNTGDAIFIPAGVWHNIVNIGRRDLKISSVYAPPHHPRCTVEKYKN